MSTPICDPHEDHEKYMGPVTKDPWDDPEQTDWPDNPKEEEENGDTDAGPPASA